MSHELDTIKRQDIVTLQRAAATSLILLAHVPPRHWAQDLLRGFGKNIEVAFYKRWTNG
jgi:hypothetical protein